jgi:hypothetical protein
MAQRVDYRDQLRRAPDPVRFLRKNSRLPGPRANLELVQAAAEAGDESAFRRWIAAGSGNEPTDEFVAMCGVVGLGRLIAEGDRKLVGDLRAHATDPRLRVREGVAMALQRVGDRSVDTLFRVIHSWAAGRPYLQRAAIAAVCEPRLLKEPAASTRAVELVDRVTALLARASDWIIAENLKKARLHKTDPAWAARLAGRLRP